MVAIGLCWFKQLEIDYVGEVKICKKRLKQTKIGLNIGFDWFIQVKIYDIEEEKQIKYIKIDPNRLKQVKIS